MDGVIIPSRVIYDYELIYIEEGQLLLQYAGVDYLCKKGCFLLLRPGISHSFLRVWGELSQPHIHFDITYIPGCENIPVCFQDMDELTAEEQRNIRQDVFAEYPQQPFVTFANGNRALELFYEIVTRSSSDSDLIKKALLIQLLDMLIADNFPAALQKNNLMTLPVEVQAKNYIDAGLGMSYSLDNFASQFNYSKYHLERRFKARYGIPLLTYRNKQRMALAENMLKSESVSAVAEKLGFSTVFVFSRAYKSRFGYPPSKVRK